MADVAYRPFPHSEHSHRELDSRKRHDKPQTSHSKAYHKNAPAPKQWHAEPPYRPTSRSAQPTKSSTSTQRVQASEAQAPYTLDVMCQPSPEIPLGRSIHPAVLISSTPSRDSNHSSSYSSTSKSRHHHPTSITSTHNLLAVATLLSEPAAGRGTRAPLPATAFTGPSLFDNPHELPREYLAQLPCELQSAALGYASFPGLVVRQPGVYRVRVTLLRMCESGDAADGRQAAVSVGAVDSEVFCVYAGDGY